MRRIANGLGRLSCWKRAYAVFVLCAAAAIALPAQTFTTLFSFDGVDGQPLGNAGLVQATDGKLYGTTSLASGGGGPYGTVFKIATTGQLTTLYSFCIPGPYADCLDGDNPLAGLVQATNGDFYGTTNAGGASSGSGDAGFGTVFKITPGGMLTTLYNFCLQSPCSDGSYPGVALVQATNGALYGTTNNGGVFNGESDCLPGCGTVFKITPTGQLTTLYSFCSQSGCADGANPGNAALIQATDGSLYGTTVGGGNNVSECQPSGCGTIFKITTSGKLTTLHRFCSKGSRPPYICADGSLPEAALVQGTDGNFYGTTAAGGTTPGALSGSPYGGTVFKITPTGTLTTLYNFCSQGGANCSDGFFPGAALVQGTDGNFYGTTSVGGAANDGTIFEITPSGSLTTLYNFCSQSGCTDGERPEAALIQATNGNFYGITSAGGANFCDSTPPGCGTVFSLSVGLGPFVETQTTSGKVGAAVKILGTNLTGATSVTFNGTVAHFKVASSSEITAIVPTGATTGTVQVVTPGGTLSSNVPFRVP